MKQSVRYVPRVRSTEIIPIDFYQINKNGKFVWLQKLCWKLLKKYGKPDFIQQYSIKCVDLEFKKVIDLIMQNIDAVHQIEQLECKYIVIGHNKLKELMSDDISRHYFSFQIPRNAELNHQQRMFLGMRIILCPWIDGVFCLPEIK